MNKDIRVFDHDVERFYYTSIDPTAWPFVVPIADPIVLVTLRQDGTCTITDRDDPTHTGTWHGTWIYCDDIKHPDYITARQSPAIAERYEAMSAAMGRTSRATAWDTSKCATCRNLVDPARDFKNVASYREWFITAFCQACQDTQFEAFEQ